MTFALYPEEAGWWSFNDYQAVLDVMAQVAHRRVLEFGPGSSTLALIEGGAERIDTCEDNEDWARVWDERLVLRFPMKVYQHRYTWSETLSVNPLVDASLYDLALIDGPHTTPKRPPVIRYCLERCHRVLVPTEDDGRKHKSYLRPILAELAAEYEAEIEFRETGPLSGGFALLTRF